MTSLRGGGAQPVQSGETAVDAAVRVVRHAGGRATVALRCVVAALEEAEGHRSAEEIVTAVAAEYPDISESTVYRTLDRLEELDIAYHVHLGHGPSQWHLAGWRSHQHLICRKCGCVIEVAAGLFTPLAQQLEDHYGFRADVGHFAMSGTCRSCSAAGN
jgi:Fur family transcriptional regulator, ferric uptake regulator